MISWLDVDRSLPDRLAALGSRDDRIDVLSANITAGESLLASDTFDTRLTCDVMIRLAASYLLLTRERTDPEDAKRAALWAIRAGRRALRSDVDTVAVVPRTLAVSAATLNLLTDEVLEQAVAETEKLLAGYVDAVARLHEETRGS